MNVISGWFYGAPIETLKRDNIIDWILWAFYAADVDRDADREMISDHWHEEIDEFVTRIEKIAGRTFAPGRNKHVKTMRVTFDPVVALHRPLLWYFVSYHLYTQEHVRSCHLIDCIPRG
jgi:hypothetical protein